MDNIITTWLLNRFPVWETEVWLHLKDLWLWRQIIGRIEGYSINFQVWAVFSQRLLIP